MGGPGSGRFKLGKKRVHIYVRPWALEWLRAQQGTIGKIIEKLIIEKLIEREKDGSNTSI